VSGLKTTTYLYQKLSEQQAQLYGADVKQLLDAIFDGNSPDWLRQIPAVETLRRVVQQYYVSDNRIHWRTEQGIPPATG